MRRLNPYFAAPQGEIPAEEISTGFQSTNPNHRIVVEELDLEDLHIDPSIQRGEEPGEIAAIVARFNEAALGTLTASARSGKGPGVITRSLLDGQQRRAVLLQLRAKGEWPEGKVVKVLVHYGLSHKEEAQLFLDLNYRRAVPPLRRFRTRLIAEDPTALRIKKILDEFDIQLTTGLKGFQAVQTAERIIKQDNGADRLRWSLKMIKSIYGTEYNGCWDGRLIEAFALVHASYITQIDEERLIDKLSAVGDRPSKLLGAGRTRKEINGGQIQPNIGDAIINFYNASKQREAKVPKRLPFLPRRKMSTVADFNEEPDGGTQ
jgi:hypothetical protein